MSLVNLSDWTPEQVDAFEQTFRELKRLAGNEPMALPPMQRDIAVQLGLMPPLSVVVEVQVGSGIHRGLLSLCEEDGVYRGSAFAAEGTMISKVGSICQGCGGLRTSIIESVKLTPEARVDRSFNIFCRCESESTAIESKCEGSQ